MDNKYIGQQCQDEQINNDFKILHKTIVNEIITFCKNHDIIIDGFNINADNLEDSILCGEWMSSTDSAFVLDKFNDEYKQTFWECNNNKVVSKQDAKRIIAEQKPFLYSI